MYQMHAYVILVYTILPYIKVHVLVIKMPVFDGNRSIK